MAGMFTGFVETTTRFLGVLSLSIPAYVIIALGLWFFSDARRCDATVGSAFRFVFPAEVYRNHSARVDFWHMLVSITLWGELLSLLFAIWAGINLNALLVHQFGALQPFTQTLWVIALVQFLVISLLRDLGFWTGHYLMHVVPILWRFHRAHHSAEHLSIFTSYRLHPMDRIITRVFHTTLGAIATGGIMYLTGSPLLKGTVMMLGLFATVVSIKTLFDHGTIWVGYGPLNWIVSSPMMHQIHHSAERKHWDRNLAEFWSLWDWLFGTIYVPSENEVFAKGIRPEEIGETNPHKTLWEFYWEPCRTFWSMLKEGKLDYWRIHPTTSALDAAGNPVASNPSGFNPAASPGS